MFPPGSNALSVIAGRRTPRRPTSRRRLRFEAMEARRLLAVYIVDSFDDSAGGFCAADNQLGNDGCTLRSAIIAANANPGPDEIRLPAGTYTLSIANDNAFDATEGSLDITDSVTIVGMTGNPADVIIDGNQLDSVFTVSAVDTGNITVKFENLTIQNGMTDEEGAGIDAAPLTRVEIINSILQNNRVDDPFFAFAGGAVHSSGSLLIENSIIRNNQVQGGIGGGVAFFGDTDTELTVRNTTFQGNTASVGGGLFVSQSSEQSLITIEEVAFSENTAGSEGGGAYLASAGQVNLSNVGFIRNFTPGDGGGLYVFASPAVSIASGAFLDNVANSVGGGLYLSEASTVLIAAITFADNVADGGGAIFANQTTILEVRGSRLERNRAEGLSSNGGGAIRSLGSLLIANSVIDNNVATFGGGVAFSGQASGSLDIRNSTLLGNSAAEEGGGLFVSQSSEQSLITIEEVAFSENTAGSEGGGAYLASAGQVNLSNVGFIRNSTPGDGGGLYVFESPAVSIASGAFLDNVANFRGGGLYLSEASTVLIAAITFADNVADGGGAIFANQTTILEVRGSRLERNRAEGLSSNGGGAIRSLGSLLIANSVIDNNVATFGGGVAFSGQSSDSLTIRDSTFLSNTASDTGGGLDAVGNFNASVSIENVTFEQNTAGLSGGGAYVYIVGAVNVSDSRFLSNTTDESGGGLYLLDTGPVLISRTTFDGNAANGGGGGGLALLTDAEIEDSLFQNNHVTGIAFAFDEGGGGIAIAQDFGFQPTVSITRSTIRNNTAPLGGGIGAANANLTISDSSILGNEATNLIGGGGGIGFAQADTQGAAARVTLLIFASTIDNNQSAADAGGVGIADADATIIDSSITNNSAAGRGGGVGMIGLNNSPRGKISASTIAGNSAGGDGGGLAAVDAGIDLLNVTISDNSAGSFGGGISFANTNESVTGSIAFTTIASNSSAAGGSNVASAAAPLSFDSTLIADPLSTGAAAANFVAGPGAVFSSGFNLDSDGSGGFNQPGDLNNAAPLFGALADNGGPVFTRALLPGSPAIDSGGFAPLPADARGLTRPRDGNGNGESRNDIGSFEVQQFTPIFLSLGDLVFLDVNNTGFFDPLVDSGLGGVSLSLFRDANLNGVLDPSDPLIDSTVTDASGNYLFTELSAGDYIVRVDLNNFRSFSPAGPLLGHIPSTGNQPTPDPNNNVDNDNNGFFVPGIGAVSAAITLAAGTEPAADGNTNLTLDFGFTLNAIVAVDDPATTLQGMPVTIDVLANDFDDVNSMLSLFDVIPPSNGAVQIIGNQLVYTPVPGFVGVESFEYIVSNPFDQQGTATVTVEVTPAAADEADLAVSIDAFPRDGLLPGQLVEFSIFVDNLSNVTATGVVVSTELSSNLIFQSGSSDVGNLSHFNNVITLDGFSLSENAFISFTITAQVSEFATPPLFEFAFTEVSSDLIDPATFNNFDSVDVTSESTMLHTLTTGSGDGGVVIQVDSFGGFGPFRFSSSGSSGSSSGSSGSSSGSSGSEAIVTYDPVGPIAELDAVFESYVAIREGTTGSRTILEENMDFVIDVPVGGSETVAISRFRFDSLVVQLTQRVESTFDSQGNRIGSRLTQSYEITNLSQSDRTLDLARFLDADLLLNSSDLHRGGVLFEPDGSLIVFTTNRDVPSPTDATFIGIVATGGATLLQDRFDVDDFSMLQDRVIAGDPLRDRVSGDLNGNGSIDPGQEYDAALALRNLLAINVGQTMVYETTTFFGARPAPTTPPPPAGDLVGRVFCDVNGNGIQDPGEAMAGVTVFIDRNGNRILDREGPNPEPFTVTDSEGNYVFTGLGLPPGSTANVVVQNPPGCFPHVPEIGVTRVAVPTGSLSRAIEAVDFNGNGQIDLIVANDLSNDLTVLINDGGNFSVAQTIPLGNRPQSISVWQPNPQTPAVIAVAAIGTPATGGLLYVIENGNVQTFPSGDGPISVIVNDFNGDGRADFVTASFRSGTIVGSFSGESEQRVLATASSPRSVTSGFINGDSTADLVVVSSGYANDTDYELIVLLNDGNGNFSPLRKSIDGKGGVDVAVADFIGNGQEEIAVASYDGTVRIFTLDASGASLQLLTTLRTEVGIEAIAAKDLNGDGFVDLVIANAKAETIELFMGTASGFVRNRTITGVPSPADLTVADFNGDGFIDVAVANLYGTSQPFRLPSTATILELTVSEREVMLTANQSTRADFGFAMLPTERLPRTPDLFNFDVNRDGQVTAMDALLILNSMSSSAASVGGEAETATAGGSRFKTDVNGDGQTTALDALLVLNRLARLGRDAASPAGESLENQSLADLRLASDAPEQDRRRREQVVDGLFAGESLLF